MKEKHRSTRSGAPDDAVPPAGEEDQALVPDGESFPESGPEEVEEATGVAEAETTPAVEMEDPAEQLRHELDALNDRHLRLAAEFDNYRKRHERERIEHRARSQAELVAGLLEVLDDLERVAEYDATTATVESFVEGVRLVERKLRTLLETAGLEPVDVADRPFDPATMEAMATVPTSEPDEDDVVADVFQRGYRFKDILVRPARVRVKKYDPEADN